ncbi:voltage-gated potassium channel subunit beta-2 isoform X3, partial [Tachysurus ichikawai]
MFASRGASGKGGKFSVEDLYGFGKKMKASSGTGGSVCCKAAPRGHGVGKKKESEALASQILEAAQRLVERRRLELYLRESGLSIQDCQSETQAMLY